MAPTRKNDGLLARVNFPLYTLQMLTNHHVLVAGGGGSAKTGVANGFEIFELSYDGKRFVAKEVVRHETGPKVVMNCSSFANNKHTYLAAGQESHCQLYRIAIAVEKETKSEDNSVNGVRDSNLRHRKSDHNGKSTSNSKEYSKKLVFKFNAGDSVQTDFNENESCQRVVTISRNGEWMATGGTDCQVRVWKFPALQPARLLKGHSRELDDLHFSPDSQQLVSVAKDGLAIVWCVRTGKQLHSLTWDPPPSTKYLFKRCRFGSVESDPRRCRVYTISNGLAKSSGGWVHSWEEGRPIRSAAVSEALSALAVRDDGTFIAIGTMFTGSISIYIAFSLQRVLHIEGAHSMFVTGLELLPTSSASICTSSEAAVISISVDNRICIHSLPYRRTLPPWMVILLIIVTLFFTFCVCSLIGL